MWRNNLGSVGKTVPLTSRWLLCTPVTHITEHLYVMIMSAFLQDLKLESTFTSELPGDPETKNQRRQVCCLSNRFHLRFLSLLFANTNVLVKGMS